MIESISKKKTPRASGDRPSPGRGEKYVAVVLILCMMLIAGWEIAAKLAARPFDDLILKAEDFSEFAPVSDQWKVRLEHQKATPTDPTAIAYELRPCSCTSGCRSSSPLLVRIVHGYNMVDCMRIKQYKVELIKDHRSLNFDSVQIWRITSASGKVSIWMTTMLRTVDFSPTNVDTRDMAFPRVGTPDSPSWQPTGLKWSSFRHPIRNSHLALRSKWNSSRCDLPTFLRLRQPAWASNEMVTLVTEYHGPSVKPAEEKFVIKYVLNAHLFMMRQFHTFRIKSNIQQINGKTAM
jgi:hypothetical protein